MLKQIKITTTIIIFSIYGCSNNTGKDCNEVEIIHQFDHTLNEDLFGVKINNRKNGYWFSRDGGEITSMKFYNEDTLRYKLELYRGVIIDSIVFEKQIKQYVKDFYGMRSFYGFDNLIPFDTLNYSTNKNVFINTQCVSCHNSVLDKSGVEIVDFVENYRITNASYNVMDSFFIYESTDHHKLMHLMIQRELDMLKK